MIIKEEDYLAHYGILRRSGRYPWGSGETQSERNRSFLSVIEGHKKAGMTETEIAKAYSTKEHPFTTTQLRAVRSIAKNEERAADIAMATRLQERGWSNVKIGERMQKPESTIRAMLAPGQREKADILVSTANMLRDEVDRKKFIDVGSSVELHLGISQTRLSTAVARLREEGYETHSVKVEQLGTGKFTDLKILAPPGTTQREVWQNRHNIQQIDAVSGDGGRSYSKPKPLSIDSKRVAVRYKEQGGTEADGVIYVRPGVDDISLGMNRYAQVRVMVDGSHYLKGMAVYKDGLPKGVDLMFNTNKSSTGNKLDAMKPLKTDKTTGEVDPDLPFGSITRPLTKRNSKGDEITTSVMNIVNDEGDWEKWSKTLSSQMLSKQRPPLAKQQLDMTHERRRKELDEILALTNPAVKAKLLEEFSDGADSAAIHLKAAGMPKQKTHVILPVNSMRETEVYAPGYNEGERVVLIRFPHGGIFEIPELVVNNRNAEAKKLLGNAPNAIGIHSKVAQRLSGADFDGDTVLVIPNNNGAVKTKPPLEGLKNFDPQGRYPAYDGMQTIDGGVYNAKTKKVEFAPGRSSSSRGKGTQMGLVSNLITDMTLQGANDTELAAAVRHSMVVIDSEKHALNWKQSAIDNGIANLAKKYQNRAQGGAATLISQKKSVDNVLDRVARKASEGGPVDPATGRKVYVNTGATVVDKKGNVVPRKIKVNRLGEALNANDLTSGTKIEKIYADYSNSTKALANEARRARYNIKTTPYSPTAKAAYAEQVKDLTSKLKTALRNSPLERQAQVVANSIVAQKKAANPDMEKSELKKVKAQALTDARMRVGAGKERIEITDHEWLAIQAGAISQSMLGSILDNSDMKRVRELATPRNKVSMTATMKQRAQTMLDSGFTQAQVATALGVSVNTIVTDLGV